MSQPEEYIKQQAADGKLDSEGVFTVAEQRMRSASTFRLRSSSAWVLCIVQSAVSGGAEAIRFKQTERHTKVSYDLCEAYDTHALTEALQTSKAITGRSENYLMSALQALALADARIVTLKVLNGLSQYSYSWNGKKWDTSRKTLRKKSEPKVTVVLAQEFGMRAWNQAEETRTLLDARVCPIPLYLDRRRIDSYQEIQTRVTSQTVSLLAMAAVPESDQTFFSFVAPKSLLNLENRKIRSDRMLDSRPLKVMSDQNDRLDFIWQYRYHYLLGKTRKVTRRSRAEWIIDGVLASGDDMIGLKEELSITLYLDGSDLKTDANGYSFHRSTKSIRVERIETALKRLQPDLEQLIGIVEKHKFRSRFFTSSSPGLTVLFQGSVGVAFAGLALLIPPIAAVGSYALGFIGSNFLFSQMKDQPAYRLLKTNCIFSMKRFNERLDIYLKQLEKSREL